MEQQLNQQLQQMQHQQQQQQQRHEKVKLEGYMAAEVQKTKLDTNMENSENTRTKRGKVRLSLSLEVEEEHSQIKAELLNIISQTTNFNIQMSCEDENYKYVVNLSPIADMPKAQEEPDAEDNSTNCDRIYTLADVKSPCDFLEVDQEYHVVYIPGEENLSPDHIPVMILHSSTEEYVRIYETLNEKEVFVPQRIASHTVPAQNMLCVVKNNGVFRRALVNSYAEQRKTVDVSFLDILGGTTVSTEDLYKCDGTFLFPAMVIYVRMADIAPLEADGWNTDVCSSLDKELSQHDLAMLVVNTSPGSLEVVIKKQSGRRISSKIVKQGWAKPKKKQELVEPDVVVEHESVIYDPRSPKASSSFSFVSRQESNILINLGPSSKEEKLCRGEDLNCPIVSDKSLNYSPFIDLENVKPIDDSYRWSLSLESKPGQTKDSVNMNSLDSTNSTESAESKPEEDSVNINFSVEPTEEEEVSAKGVSIVTIDYYYDEIGKISGNEEVKILSVENSQSIWLRKEDDEVDYNNTKGLLDRYCRHQQHHQVESSNLAVDGAYLCHIENAYIRVIIKKVVFPQITVFALDLGVTRVVGITQLFKLPPQFACVPCLSIHVKLTGIKEIDYPEFRGKVADMLAARGATNKVFLKNTVKTGMASFEGELMFVEDQERWNNTLLEWKLAKITASQMLVKSGVAKMVATKIMSESETLPTTFEEEDSDLQSNGLCVEFPVYKQSTFEGIIKGVDNKGLFWILPDFSFKDQNVILNLNQENFTQVKSTQTIKTGEIYFVRDELISSNAKISNRNYFRVLIVSAIDVDIFYGVKIDQDGAKILVSQNKLMMAPGLKANTIVTLPVQLLGVTVKGNIEGKKIYDQIRRVNPAMSCSVQVKMDTPRYPVQGEIYLEPGSKLSINLGLKLLQESRDFSFFWSLEGWRKALEQTGLDWFRAETIPTKPLPNLFPFENGVYFPMKITAFGETIDTDGRIFIQLARWNLNPEFEHKNKTKIKDDLSKIASMVTRLDETFIERKEHYAKLAESGKNENWQATVGSRVLAFFEDAENTNQNEWARGVVKSFSADKASVHFIDYGNADLVRVENLRELSTDEHLEPSHVIRARFECPASQERMSSLLKQLEVPRHRLGKVRQMKNGEILIHIFEIEKVGEVNYLRKLI